MAVRKRDALLAGYATANPREPLSSADADVALREVCRNPSPGPNPYPYPYPYPYPTLTPTQTQPNPNPTTQPNPNPNPSNQVCAALIRWGEAGEEVGEQPALSAGAQAMATYLDAGGLAVPRDLGVLPAEALRALVAAQTEPS